VDKREHQEQSAAPLNSTNESSANAAAQQPSEVAVEEATRAPNQTVSEPENSDPNPLTASGDSVSEALQDLFEQAPLETAAGPSTLSGGGSRYEDQNGSILELLEGADVVPPTDLTNSLFSRFDTTVTGPVRLNLANAGFRATTAVSNLPPVADPIFNTADNGAVPPALSAALREAGENPASVVAFKSLSVDGEVSDSDDGRTADFGGSDPESDLSELLFTLTSDPSHGRLFVRDTDGAVRQLLTSGDSDGDPDTSNAFGAGDEIWWVATTSDLTPEIGDTVTAGGRGAQLTDWTDTGIQLTARDFDGIGDQVARSGNGIGVLGGNPAPSQINHNAQTGESETLEILLPTQAIAAEVTISNLFPNEGPGGAGETGLVRVLLGEVEIGAFTFGDQRDDPTLDFDLPIHVGSFTLDESVLGAGQVFDRLIFEALDYAGGALRPGDSSDYFVRQVTFTEADYSDSFGAALFSYRVTDENGNSSAPASVSIQGPADPGGQTFVVNLSFDGASVSSGADDILGGLVPGDTLVFQDVLDQDGDGQFSLDELLPHVTVTDGGFGEGVTVSFDGGGQVTLAGIGTGATDSLQDLMDQGFLVAAAG